METTCFENVCEVDSSYGQNGLAYERADGWEATLRQCLGLQHWADVCNTAHNRSVIGEWLAELYREGGVDPATVARSETATTLKTIMPSDIVRTIELKEGCCWPWAGFSEEVLDCCIEAARAVMSVYGNLLQRGGSVHQLSVVLCEIADKYGSEFMWGAPNPTDDAAAGMEAGSRTTPQEPVVQGSQHTGDHESVAEAGVARI